MSTTDIEQRLEDIVGDFEIPCDNDPCPNPAEWIVRFERTGPSHYLAKALYCDECTEKWVAGRKCSCHGQFCKGVREGRL